MYKKIKIVIDNRVFECAVVPELSGAMCGVSIDEVVRPNWFIFKKSYRGYRTFWVDDFNTIAEGVECMVKKYLADEAQALKIDNKWKELE